MKMSNPQGDYLENPTIQHELKRAKVLLERADTPEFLINYWNAVGNLPRGQIPFAELVSPWQRGIEHLL